MVVIMDAEELPGLAPLCWLERNLCRYISAIET